MSKEKLTFTDVLPFMHAVWGPREKQPGHEDLYDAAGRRLVKLQGLAQSALGELILVIRRTVETMGCSMGMPSPLRWPRVEMTLQLGVLQPPGFMMGVIPGPMKDAVCQLMTVRNIHAWHGMGKWCTRMEEGPIGDNLLNLFWLHLDVPLEVSAPFRDPEKRLEVIAGDEAVYAWFTDEGELPLLRKMGRELGLTIDFPALREYDVRTRAALASALEPLWAGYNHLRSQIAGVMNAGKRGDGVISLDGVSITLCETEDDAHILTWGMRDKLKEFENNLRRHLDMLRELGVDDTTPNIHLIRHIAEKLKVPLA